MNADKVKPIFFQGTATVDNNTLQWDVDTLVGGVSFRQAVFFVYIAGIDIATSVFKVRESSVGGAYADIEETVAGGDGFPLPGATDDNHWYMIAVSDREQLLRLIITVGDGSTGASITGFCLLDNPVALGLDALLPAARGMTGREVIV